MEEPNFNLVMLGFQLLGILISGVALFILKKTVHVNESYLLPIFAVIAGITMGVSWAYRWRYKKLEKAFNELAEKQEGY
jgi:ABC-type maltose transport system permease subunit